jgi:plasmid maintenance system killer protein
MKLLRTTHFERNATANPACLRQQSALLLQNLHHPSLRAKKYDERLNLWQARVNQDWRFYFPIQNDAYLIVDIIPHPK